MNKLFLKLLLISCLSFLSVFMLNNSNVANAASFDAGRIIDDPIFTNKSTMSVNDIQNFLNSKVPVCDTNHQGGSPSYPPPYICLKNYSEGGRSAAQIIYDAAQQYSINPQVILVTLQKENGLVTDSWPYPWQYRTAMGFGCPDGEPCDAQWYGFTNQINQGARHLRNFYDLNPNWYIPFSPGVRFIPYNPNGGCGGSNVNIINRGTAALYSYTPYQPNAAALSTKYGTGDGCSAYGNRNFFNYFNDWFGNSRIDSFSVALDESNSQYLLFGGLKQAITDPQVKIAWGIQDYPLTSMSSSYLSTIPSGPNLDRLTRLNTSDSTVFFMDSGKRYRVMSQSMLDLSLIHI